MGLNSKFEQEFEKGCLVRRKKKGYLHQDSYITAVNSRPVGRGTKIPIGKNCIICAFDYEFVELNDVELLFDLKVMKHGRFWHTSCLVLVPDQKKDRIGRSHIEKNLKLVIDSTFECVM